MATAERMCCVMGCPIANAAPRGTLLLFPAPNSTRYKRWLGLYPNIFLLRDSGGNYICTRHFSAECFARIGKLKLSANPSKHIDTIHAQDQILETFLIKVIYEWSLRTGSSVALQISWAAKQAADILGMKGFQPNKEWVQKFKLIRAANMANGLRFIGEDASGRDVPDIIRDLRKYLPKSFVIPTDVMDITASGDEWMMVKDECLSDDEVVSVYMEDVSDSDSVDVGRPIFELVKAENEVTTCAAIPKKDLKPLGTYQDALEMLKPLAAYVKRLGNDTALARFREITSVVQEAVQTEQKPRCGLKRTRAERV